MVIMIQASNLDVWKNSRHDYVCLKKKKKKTTCAIQTQAIYLCIMYKSVIKFSYFIFYIIIQIKI